MLFNSIEFLIFLPIVFILYWFVLNKSLKAQNALILFASYIFYGWWDWRFLFLILFSSVGDYYIGVLLHRLQNYKTRKLLLATSLVINLGLLGFFKYYNFFVESFVEAFSFFGYELSSRTLNIILPVGISFYTFQTLSYSIDVYRRKIEPCSDPIAFFAFVSFFPQLVAGPIERASNLLPQFYSHRKFNYNDAVIGLRQVLWGLFKKIVIADNCAEFANQIFGNYEALPGSTLFLGAIFFTFQIYGDFSGYSDIAIGISRLFGFNLMQNFAFPYFSRDIAEFWRRWHISLSSWFRDYLYIPLGGSRGGKFAKIRNTFIIFLVSGFWHGANWTFVIWGFLNAIYFLPLLLSQKNRTNMDVVAQGRLFPSLKESLQIFITFNLTVIAWVFFRAANLTEAIAYLMKMFSSSLFQIPLYTNRFNSIIVFLAIFIFLIIEWLGREQKFAIQYFLRGKLVLRWAFYYFIIFCILSSIGKGQDFIYFQF